LKYVSGHKSANLMIKKSEGVKVRSETIGRHAARRSHRLAFSLTSSCFRFCVCGADLIAGDTNAADWTWQREGTAD
jgi:hypothetical protein